MEITNDCLAMNEFYSYQSAIKRLKLSHNGATIVIIALYQHYYKRNEHNCSLWLHIKEMPPRTTVSYSFLGILIIHQLLQMTMSKVN